MHHITTDFASIVKDDAKALMDRQRKDMRPEFKPDLLINPRKYAKPVAVDKIIADMKVSREGVEYYKKKIEANEPIDPIVVVKHPRLDIYAVLDGHHRYWACKELGKKTIDCAVAENYSSVIFYLTEHGYLQPSAETTEHLRLPAKKMHENLKQFLEDFLDEEKIKRELEKRQKTTIQTKIDPLNKDFLAKEEQAKLRTKQEREEFKAKVNALKKKAAKARGEAKAKIKKRIADYEKWFNESPENWDWLHNEPIDKSDSK